MISYVRYTMIVYDHHPVIFVHTELLRRMLHQLLRVFKSLAFQMATHDKLITGCTFVRLFL